MSNNFDVIVVGLGAMGSAAACHLAKRGKKILGLDRFTPPHAFGSSHGQTRIIREAYFEHPLYVPLIQRAYELWAELERQAGRPLFLQTGGLMIGQPDGVLVRGAKRSAEEHHLQHEMLTAHEVRLRFPVLTPSDDMVAVWEARAGILFPEACIEVHLAAARTRGARLHFAEQVLRWDACSSGVNVRTSRGEYQAERLILTAGSWINSLLPDLKLPFSVERQVLFWFEPRTQAAAFHPDRCPIHIWEHEPGEFFYGFPDLGNGVKVARHHQGERADPDKIRREVDAVEIESMQAVVRRFLPSATGPLRSSAVCMYTDTPDEHFFIDAHPAFPQVTIASPCSGHGFKFSCVIGEILADHILGDKSRFDLSLFRNRFS
ncbi:MAG: N-methyl-L-tryptophan oxidase [Verrucomicrobia bacterium]|nr:N-methyl-L-tryptophan oxidase [Verrucomicrobiota bacterium]